MTLDKSFLDVDVAEIVKKLKVDERVSLLGAPNWWNTTGERYNTIGVRRSSAHISTAIPRLNIPSVRMSDGPNVSSFDPTFFAFLTI